MLWQDKGWGGEGGEQAECTTVLCYLCNHPNLFLNFNKTWFCNMCWNASQKIKKCSTRVSHHHYFQEWLPLPKRALQGWQVPQHLNWCRSRLGVSLSQPVPWKFSGESRARHEMGKESLAMMHPASELGTQPPLTAFLQQTASQAWNIHLSRLPGSGRGGGQRADFERCLQFNRKNMWSQLLIPAVLLPSASHWNSPSAPSPAAVQLPHAWLRGLRDHRLGDGGEIGC